KSQAQGFMQQPHTSVLATVSLVVGMLSLFIGTVIQTFTSIADAFGDGGGTEISGPLRYGAARAAIACGTAVRMHGTRQGHLTGGVIAVIGVLLGVVGLYLAA